MEKKKYSINNSNLLILDGDNTQIKILAGHAFLFIVRKLENGKTGARHEIKNFEEGSVCPNIPGTAEYEFFLAGTEGTQVEVVGAENLDLTEDFYNFAETDGQTGNSDENSTENPGENAELSEIQKKNLLLQKKIIANLEKQEIEESQRNIQQQKLSDDYFSQAVTNIASVVNPKLSESAIYENSDQSVVKAFKLLAAKTGDMSIKTVPGRIYTADKTGVQLLAKDNAIRIREVVLRGKWYKEDNGHLFAFYNKNHDFDLKDSLEGNPEIIPVALIRDNVKNRYVLYNCETQEQIIVNGKNAKQIYPMAFMIYKKLGNEKIFVKDILKFVLKDIKNDLVNYIIIGFICTLIGLITPYITRNLIDRVIPNAARLQAIQICVLAFGCNIASMVGGIAKYFAGLRMETRADSDLEAAVMDRLLKLPVNFFKKYSAGDLSARAMAITKIRKQIYGIILSCFMNFIFSFVYLAQEFRFCGYFAKWGIIFCIFPILISLLTSFITYKMEKALIDSQGKLQGMLLQFFNGIQKITNSNSEKRVFSEWSKEYVRQTKIGYKLGNFGIYMNIINSIYPTLVTIIMYYLFGMAIQSQKIEGLSTGTFLAFLSAYGSFQSAFLGVAGSLISIRNVIPLQKRIKPILDEKTEVEDSKPAISNLKGAMEISHLNFRYEENSPLVLKDINMKIEPGEFVAIVGTSGAGKSTLLRMILGFEKPESGSIFVDGMDINSIDITSLRRQMGVVLQNDTVLSGTIMQNIVGSSGLKEEDAWEAARKVSFDRDIANMPMGMFTMVPAGGRTLSGGQLQRLIIARALIRNPKLLIFDEATSALDNVTQLTVRKSLDELKVTRIIIAHRLSTIINADKIYVMKDGEVIENGTYESLMKQNGYFAQLAKRQSV